VLDGGLKLVSGRPPGFVEGEELVDPRRRRRTAEGMFREPGKDRPRPGIVGAWPVASSFSAAALWRSARCDWKYGA